MTPDSPKEPEALKRLEALVKKRLTGWDSGELVDLVPALRSDFASLQEKISPSGADNWSNTTHIVACSICNVAWPEGASTLCECDTEDWTVFVPEQVDG